MTRRSYALELKRFPGALTYSRVAEELENTRQLYNISADKIVACVTDNGKILDSRVLCKVVMKVDVYKYAIQRADHFITCLQST